MELARYRWTALVTGVLAVADPAELLASQLGSSPTGHYNSLFLATDIAAQAVAHRDWHETTARLLRAVAPPANSTPGKTKRKQVNESPPKEAEPWLNTRQAAQVLGMSEKTIDRLRNDGALVGHRSRRRGRWRYRRVDVDAVLVAQSTRDQGDDDLDDFITKQEQG